MRLRPGTSRDVATFTRLINAHYRWLRGEDEWQEDELAAILISPTGEPADNDRYLEVGGEDVAGVHVHIGAPFTKGTVRIALPPGPDRARYARTLLEAAERIVASNSYTAAHGYLQMDVPREDTELVDVARQLGYDVAQKVTILEGEVLDAPAAGLARRRRGEHVQHHARPRGRLHRRVGGAAAQAWRMAPVA